MIVFILTIGLLYGCTQLPFVQKKITHYISEKISKSIGLQASVSHISYWYWNKLVLSDLKICNAANDTIIFSPKVTVKIQTFNRKSSHIQLKGIKIQNAYIHLEKNKQGIWNIDALFKKFDTKSDSKPWTIGITDIEIVSSKFKLKNLLFPQNQEYGINFDNMYLENIFAHIYNFETDGNSFKASLNRVSAKEKSGFNLQYLQTDVQINDTLLKCKDVLIFTPKSKIYADSLTFDYKKYGDFLDFIDKVHFKGTFTRSELSLSDIAYFAPALQNNPYDFNFSGIVQGKISNIKGKNLSIGYGRSTRFLGNIEISGLPDINETFLHISAKNFETNEYDITHFRIPPYSEESFFELPVFFKDIKEYSYTGNFTGFLYDFVAYGTLVTDAGTVYSDILISKSSEKNLYNYSGKLTLDKVFLPKISLDSSMWGYINSTFEINGTYNDQSLVSANIKGSIQTLDFNNYTYSNISVDGILSNQKFDGNVNIKDPNILLAFHGLFDFSTEIPSFKFNAKIDNAQLYKLGFYDKDSLATISLTTEVDFIGLQLDNLKGFISIPFASYSGKFGSYDTHDAFVDIDNINQTRNVSIKSDLFDLTINGKGNYKELPSYFFEFLQSHITVLPIEQFKSKKTVIPSFNLSLRIKKIDSLFKVIYPDIHISQNSYLNTVFIEDKKQFIVNSKIPELEVNGIKVKNIEISSEGNVDEIVTSCVFDYEKFKGISSVISIKNDSLWVQGSWKNNEEKRYEGNISCVGSFKKATNKYFPAIDLHINPSTIFIADSMWNVFESELYIDSTDIAVKYGSFGKNNQTIKLSGAISQNPQKEFSAEFYNYNLENFNYLIDIDEVKIKGEIQGSIKIKDFYNERLIFANILAPDFIFNNHRVGKLTAISEWIPLQQAIAMNVSLQQGSVKIISAVGTYEPESDKINFELSVKDLRLSHFKEIFAGTLNNLSGYVDGDFSATGKLSNPIFAGDIEVKRGKFLVDYTQTPYSFKGKMHSQGSKFIFFDIPVLDTLTNVSLASGFVDLKDITNPAYQINLETEKLLVINTKDNNNEMFYGTVFYQGDASIVGDLHYTKITAVGKTLPNTECNIPLTYSELTANKDFLRFSDTSHTQKVNSKEVSSDYPEVSINLNVTPDALTQIIFDQKVGDVIKVKGNGNIQMQLNKHGDFTIYGDYLIDHGDYLFTLKNLINKKFIIQQGGTISFNGDPFDAQIDILANYELKTSPQPIMDSSYTKRIPVSCNISLEGNLMNPEITYDITVPSNASQVQAVINALDSDQKNRQFLALLIMNTFYSDETQNLNTSAGFEVLSNQLNNVLAQMNSNVDVGLNYRPSDIYTGNEFELELSTQLLNDRILVNVNGYTEFGNTPSAQVGNQSNDFAGDVSVEVKINKEGTFKIKGFSRSNTDPLAENQANTQGVSLFFTREFNDLRQLLSKK